MTPSVIPEPLPFKIQLSIASLNFDITCENYRVIQEDEKSYEQFLRPNLKTGAKPLSVRLLMYETMPRLDTLTKTFDSTETWAMYNEPGLKYISFQPLSKNTPDWIARINEGLNKIDIYCSNSLIRQTNEGEQVLANPVCYPLDQILLTNLLLGRGLLVHAAGIIIDDKGYLFAGTSGAGKSTISELCQANKTISILSDDRIVIEKTGQDICMYGTPWPGDAGIAVNDSARLHGIFFINHAEDNSINELSPGDGLKNLLKVTSLPLYDEFDLQKSLDFCDDLLKIVKTYELNFRPGPEIVEDILSFVSG